MQIDDEAINALLNAETDTDILGHLKERFNLSFELLSEVDKKLIKIAYGRGISDGIALTTKKYFESFMKEEATHAK